MNLKLTKNLKEVFKASHVLKPTDVTKMPDWLEIHANILEYGMIHIHQELRKFTPILGYQPHMNDKGDITYEPPREPTIMPKDVKTPEDAKRAGGKYRISNYVRSKLANNQWVMSGTINHEITKYEEAICDLYTGLTKGISKAKFNNAVDTLSPFL